MALVIDGFVGRLAVDDGFVAADQRATLLDTVERLLAPQNTSGLVLRPRSSPRT